MALTFSTKGEQERKKLEEKQDWFSEIYTVGFGLAISDVVWDRGWAPGPYRAPGAVESPRRPGSPFLGVSTGEESTVQ